MNPHHAWAAKRWRRDPVLRHSSMINPGALRADEVRSVLLGLNGLEGCARGGDGEVYLFFAVRRA
jgi:hypothetical protein